MQNQPSLHQDQQNTADHLVKTEGVKETNDFADSDEEMSEAEKEEQTKPEDFEEFNLDPLDEENINKNQGD